MLTTFQQEFTWGSDRKDLSLPPPLIRVGPLMIYDRLLPIQVRVEPLSSLTEWHSQG